ncbi:Tripartite-type tricarboxylate transporter, receptor component TctC [Polaromonas sp. OV174]|nr:Tripartite-type tricarboxylate transporter, receptor component TctC [Polaromonas sp. OV174]
MLKFVLMSLCAAAIGVQPAVAQSYPDKPVKMVVGFAPGGPTDILARVVATAMGKTLGNSVIVDNKAGGGGLLGAQSVAKAAPDGYTILFAGDGQLTLLPQLSNKAGYETQRDFAPIRMVAGQSNVLMVNKATGISDMATLIARAKASPGQLTYGSAGNGTPTHLVGALFENATGLSLLHVPYKGAGPAMTDLIGGQIDMMFVGMPVALQQAGRDQVTILAVTGNKRAVKLANVPTFTQAGIKGLGDETAVWWAVMVPAGVPQAIRSRLDAAVKEALNSPELRKSFTAQGVELLDQDATTTSQWIERDRARWATLIKNKKITAE